MPYSLLQPLYEIPLAVVDVETSGASAAFGDRVIEIGIVRIEGGQVVAEYQQLVDPRRRIGAGISALTGITQDMVDGQPAFCDVLPAVCRMLEGAAIAGHNVRFDLSFLHREFRRGRCRLEAAAGCPQVIDTLRLARRRFGRGGNALGALAARLELPASTAHRALADARTTARLLERLLEPMAGWRTPLCDVLAAQGGALALDAGDNASLLPLELEEALERGAAVVLEYLDAAGQRTCRTIQPLHVRRLRGQGVLVAHCHLRNQRRAFKLDRMVSIQGLSETPLSLGEGFGGE